MTTEITTLNRMKVELARREEQLALLQRDRSRASQSYQSRSWWLLLNATTLLIGFVIITGGFYMERTHSAIIWRLRSTLFSAAGSLP